jgi:hypothetical protein
MSTVPVRPDRLRDHRFYSAIFFALAVLVFAGFARTYYLKPLFPEPPMSLLIHVHGFVMTLWYLLFGVQVGLVATRRVAVHRKLGIAGVVLAGIAVMLATAVSMGLARERLILRPESKAAAFLLGLQLFSVLLVFVILVTLGVLYRRRPDYHKRFMTMSMLSVLGPAITRLPLSFVQNHDVTVAIVLSVSVVLLCVLADVVLNRRLHPAFGWGALLIIGSMALVAQFAQTDLWIRATRWLVL